MFVFVSPFLCASLSVCLFLSLYRSSLCFVGGDITHTGTYYIGPAKYMIGRRTTEAELERELESKPFETFNLYRGQKFGGAAGEGNYREVGRFKVHIRRCKASMEEHAGSFGEQISSIQITRKKKQDRMVYLLRSFFFSRLPCVWALYITVLLYQVCIF